MKTGMENKKEVVALGVLGLVAAYFLYTNVIAPPSPAPTGGRAAVASTPDDPPTLSAPVHAPATAAEPSPRTAARAARPAARNVSEEFHPVLHSKNPEEQIDPNTVDPRIRLDLLARLLDVPPAGSGRNLFQASLAPPPKPKGPEPIIVPNKPLPGPPDVFHEQAVAQAGPPPLPPITFKYYGLTTVRPDGKRTAFFMSGDEILIRAVGDMVAGSYRLVSIGLTSAVVEDTKSKRQQTVPLAEEAQV